ncbi:hypothetical protein LX69_00055 [Breznakibacter xylanolyticus]|uniref:Tetratricopeptide repeat protein n=1 Tax=Breznakibacter xylanolyticus TaxID=990 RepID=A0A2W7NVI7_9BACT|nr:hypothetical protein [Breznakibacter xylanolyticus]PZX20634.1 hypothetical protein LX69_00055 [Breznakibacter xylanolyticus]
MNRQQFYHYLSNPEGLNDESLSNLTAVIAEYPYFQAARMLLVKNMAVLDHIRYNHELKSAAAYIPDRKKLYFLIHAPTQSKAAKPFVEAVVQQRVSQPVVLDEPVKPDVSVEVSASPVDYFDVPDTLESPSGEVITFSFTSELVQEEPEQMVLPSADLLDYELQNLPGYQLAVQEPEDFDPSQSRSFSDWLKALHHHSVQTQRVETPKPVSRQMDIIDSFLKQGDKKIIPKPKVADERDVAENSLRESEDLMTETLANIHIKQKHYDKAITIFEKLSLKYPEKNIYFASRIQELERLINNQ